MSAPVSSQAHTAASTLMGLVTAAHHRDDQSLVAQFADLNLHELRLVLVNAVVRLDEAWCLEAERCGVTPEAFLGIMGAQVARNSIGETT